MASARSRAARDLAGAIGRAKRPIPLGMLPTVVRRVGRCLQFGCPPAELQLATQIIDSVSRHGITQAMGTAGFVAPASGSERDLWPEDYVDELGIIKLAFADQIEHEHLFSGPQAVLAELAASKAFKFRRIDGSIHFSRHKGHMAQQQNLFTYSNGPEPVRVFVKLENTYTEPIRKVYNIDPKTGMGTLPLTRFMISTRLLGRRRRQYWDYKSRWEIMCETTEKYPEEELEELATFGATALRRAMELQEVAALEARDALGVLQADITRLEKLTWDNPSAVEDMGSATTSADVEESAASEGEETTEGTGIKQ